MNGNLEYLSQNNVPDAKDTIMKKSGENKKKVRLDLFKLHDENDKGCGRIKVINNIQLKIFIKKLIKEIQKSSQSTIKDIAKELGLSYLSFYNKLFRKNCELILLKRLIEFWKNITKKSRKEVNRRIIRLQNCIKELTYGAGNTYKKVTAPKILTKNLCRIAGSVIADGHLTKYIKKSGSPSYVITVDDESKHNLFQFCSWIKEEFGTQIRPKYNRKNNYWRVDFGNKIIYRYLNKLFEIPVGKKHAIVKIPSLIKSSNLSMKISFLNGLFMFDGGIGSKTIYFNYSTKSIILLKEVEKILTELNILPDYVSNGIIPSTGVAELRIWSRNKLKNLIKIFSKEGEYNEKMDKIKIYLAENNN
jgi:ribosomal protein L18E